MIFLLSKYLHYGVNRFRVGHPSPFIGLHQGSQPFPFGTRYALCIPRPSALTLFAEGGIVLVGHTVATFCGLAFA
jgi:hypothetical protein